VTADEEVRAAQGLATTGAGGELSRARSAAARVPPRCCASAVA
jgi:hypothetical protein